jgi:hypothetical protein
MIDNFSFRLLRGRGALAATLACVGVASLAISCANPDGDVATRRAALVGDPIESVEQTGGVAPAPITLTNAPGTASIESASFTIGLFDEDEPTYCNHEAKFGYCGPNGGLCPCTIGADLDPEHRAFLGAPFPPFDDVSVVEAVVNVGNAQVLEWDWRYHAWYQKPFGEFSVEVVDQNGATTTIIDNFGAPDGTGYRPLRVFGDLPPFLSGPQHTELSLAPWSGQTIRVRFILHSNYDPDWFTFVGTDGVPLFTGAYDAGTSKVYVDNLRFGTCEVASVEFVDIDSPVDDNPAHAGGGKRIYPDRRSPTDAVDRSVVGVLAKTTKPNCPVILRSFDFDDPSTNSEIDPNGRDGHDNFASKCGSFPPAGGCEMELTSDANGRALTGFVVTKHPGDNFVIAAGTNRNQMSTLTLAPKGDTSVIKDGAGVEVPNSHVAASPMLTVWRRLHVQVDSMAQVTSNHVSGVITGAVRVTSSGGNIASAVRVSVPLVPRRYEGGRITFNGKSFNIINNTDVRIDLFDIAGDLVSSDRGSTFTLYDDDNLGGDFEVFLHGDEGFEIPAPDLSLLADSDDPSANLYARACIRPIYDLPGDGARPFALNIEEHDNPFAGQMDVASEDYWMVYLLGGYQAGLDLSRDPTGGPIRLGESIAGEGGTMFLETIRDFLAHPPSASTLDNGATTTVHEVGHLLGAQHGDKGIMGNTKKGGSITEIVLAAKSIHRVRRLVSP